MGKDTIEINDVHMAIQMAKQREYRTSSPLDNSGQSVPKNINKTSTSGTINEAQQNEAVDNIISTQSDQNVDDLPVISDLDIEEVIRSIQDNQEPIANKVMEFNVDALLNDPYTLYEPGARYFVSSSRDGSIKLWDGISNKCVNTFEKAHDGSQVCSVAFTRNGKYSLSSGKDSLVKLWELSTSRCLIAYTGAGTTGKQVHCTQALFNHTEEYVMFPDEVTTTLCACNASRQQLLSLGHNGPIRSIVHSPNSAAFLTCLDDFRAHFWYRKHLIDWSID